MPGPVSDRVVVGVDGSEQSKSSLRWAARLASALGATLEVVTAWAPPNGYGWAAPIGEWDPQADAEKTQQAALDEVFDGHRPAGLTTAVREGHASQVLVEASRGATMLVVGSRGHGGFTDLLLGSVSTACIHHAHCPVVVVRPEEEG